MTTYEELQKSVSYNLKQIERIHKDWRDLDSFGRARQDETKSLEVDLISRITEISDQVHQLQRMGHGDEKQAALTAQVSSKVNMLRTSISTAQARRKDISDIPDDISISGSSNSNFSSKPKPRYTLPAEEMKEKRQKVEEKKKMKKNI